MTAKTALANLEAAHGLFRVEDGKLYGPKGLSEPEKGIVRSNKGAFIAIIEARCSQCQADLVFVEHENYREFYCSVTPRHYLGWLTRPGRQSDAFADRPKRSCADCGWQGLTFGGLCRVCLGLYAPELNVVEVKGKP